MSHRNNRKRREEAYWNNQFQLQMQDWLEFAWANFQNTKYRTYHGGRKVSNRRIRNPNPVMKSALNSWELFKDWKKQSPVIQANARKKQYHTVGCIVYYQEAVHEMHIFLDYMKDQQGKIVEERRQQVEERRKKREYHRLYQRKKRAKEKEMGAEEDGLDYTCVVTFMFKEFTLENPLFKTKEDGSFNLDPINIIAIKFLILDDLNLEGVDYDDATLTADSILFKFNFTNKRDAEIFMENFKSYISMPERDAELETYFENVGISVRSKYQAGLLYSNMMSDIFQNGDLNSMNIAVDFLEYLSALEVEDYKYSLEVLNRKGIDSQQRDEFGLSIADILLLESKGYQNMMDYLINEIQNKGRSIDKVYFILVSDNGFQNRINATLFQIKQEVDNGVVSKVLSEQYFRNLGKKAAIEDFLYYMYAVGNNFVFDNI